MHCTLVQQGNPFIILRLTCGLLDSSAELATASNPTYAKNTTVAPVKTALKPFGANGVQFETSTLKAPTMMTKITMTTCPSAQEVVNSYIYVEFQSLLINGRTGTLRKYYLAIIKLKCLASRQKK